MASSPIRSVCRDWHGSKTIAHLVDGGVHPAGADGLDGGDGLQAASGAEAVPDHGLGAVHLDVAPVGEHLLHRLHLRHVAHQRARRVRVDVVDLGGMYNVSMCSIEIVFTLKLESRRPPACSFM